MTAKKGKNTALWSNDFILHAIAVGSVKSSPEISVANSGFIVANTAGL